MLLALRSTQFKRIINRVRLSYEFALQEAVRERREITWVAGIPSFWGEPANVVSRKLWEI